MSFPVVVDGQVHPAGTPVLAAEDQGFQLGLSAFETVRVADGRADFLDEHLARLRDGAAALGVAWPPPVDPRNALTTLIEAVGEHAPYAARITLSRGTPGGAPTLVVTARVIDPLPAAGVVVHISSLRKLGDDAVGGLKSTSRVRHVLAREEAHRAGAWEALFLTPAGDLSEGTVSNVFVVVDWQLRTPSTDHGCLGGIVRGRILEDLARAPLRVGGRELSVGTGRVTLAELERADEVLLTNTTGGVVGVREVRGLAAGARALPGPAGPVTRAVHDRLALLVARDREDGVREGNRVPGPG